MAAKLYPKLILILIIAGILVTIGARSRFLLHRKTEENRFIFTYLAMSVAREKYIGDPDSLKITMADIFKRNKTDSIWMADYGKKLSGNLIRSEQVWFDITNKLDSLQRTPKLDSAHSNHRYQP